MLQRFRLASICVLVAGCFLASPVGRAPATADFVPVKLTNPRVVYFEKLRDELIVNENVHHQIMMKQFGFERQVADEAMEAGLKTCTTASCKATFRKDNTQTQSAIDANEEDENARHAAKLKQIKTELGAEIKKLEAQIPKMP
jgi:inactivated superfamily I helicase